MAPLGPPALTDDTTLGIGESEGAEATYVPIVASVAGVVVLLAMFIAWRWHRRRIAARRPKFVAQRARTVGDESAASCAATMAAIAIVSEQSAPQPLVISADAITLNPRSPKAAHSHTTTARAVHRVEACETTARVATTTASTAPLESPRVISRPSPGRSPAGQRKSSSVMTTLHI